MSTSLNDAVYDPDLQFVIEAVPDAAESDLVSAYTGHAVNIPCSRIPCT